MWEENREWTFSLEKILLWIMDLYFSQKQWFLCFTNVINWCLLLKWSDVDYLLWCCVTCVCCCDVFISCLDSHSDGTHSLQRIHWWARDVMLHFSIFFADVETNSSTSWKTAWGWVNVQQISFVVNSVHQTEIPFIKFLL